jgi:sugar fermentation stimulation protein A
VKPSKNSYKINPVNSTPCEIQRGLEWPELLSGVLVRRYKRFCADIRLDDYSVITAHCANSGSMKTCSEPGRRVYFSRSPNPGRKLAFTLEIIEMPTSLVGLNTSVPNRLTAKALLDGEIESLKGYETLRREVRTSPNSRLDLLLEGPGSNKCFVEVKNCTLIDNGKALFPDAVTERGTRHLLELSEQVRLGNRAVIFFVVQRMDAGVFAPADSIDPIYGKTLRQVAETGVEILAYDVDLGLDRIKFRNRLQSEL